MKQYQFSSVQSLSHAQLFMTPWTAACQVSLSITNSQSLLKLMTTELVMPSYHPILCRLLLLLPSVFPASESFPVSWLFTLGGQSFGASASASVLPMNIQDWFPLGLTSLISLLSKGLSRVFSNTTPKASILRHSAFFMVQLSHLYIVKALSCVHLFATTVYGIFQARILEWVAISFSRSSWPRDHWSPTLQADFLPSEPPHD